MVLGRSRPRLTIVLLAWVVLPFVVALTFGTLSFPRHVMYVMPPLLVLMGLALVEGFKRVQRETRTRIARPLYAVGVLLLLTPALIADARFIDDPVAAEYPGPDDEQYVRDTQAGKPWPDVADSIERRATGSRVIVVTDRAYPDVIRWLLDPRDASPTSRRTPLRRGGPSS